MKIVLAHVCLLVAAFWGACSLEIARPAVSSGEVPLRTADRQTLADGWRRTVNGWERSSQWTQTPPARLSSVALSATAIHPLNVAVLQALLSIGALLMLSPQANEMAARHSASDGRPPDPSGA